MYQCLCPTVYDPEGIDAVANAGTTVVAYEAIRTDAAAFAEGSRVELF